MGKQIGSLLGLSSEKPREDPELARQRAEMEARQKAERAKIEKEKKDRVNRYRKNQIGSKSLQDEELEGMTGFKTTKLMSGKTGYSKSLNNL